MPALRFSSALRRWCRTGCAVLCLVSGAATAAYAGDWPQILGPSRNGIATDERLANTLPPSGPAVVWQRSVGEGLAGVAVAQGRLVLFHRVGDEERVEALQAATGDLVWKTDFPTHYAGSISEDNGPRCVPLIYDGHVYLCGAEGGLYCVALNTGKTRWSRQAARDFGATEGYFGFGSTPIIEGDKLLINVGGKGRAGIVALSLADGKTVWQATSEQASYSSPTAATLDGARHVIFVTRLNVVSLDPNTGAVRFTFPFGQRGPTVNAATPLIIGGGLFVSASYGVGAAYARIGKQGAESVWANDGTMSSQYSTCVLHKGDLYGSDGRQDVGRARLRCFDPRTGKVHWTKNDFGVATFILADEKLLIMKTDGELVLATPSPQEFKPLGSARLLGGTTRPLPALSEGLFFVRDQKTLKCVDLRRKP